MVSRGTEPLLPERYRHTTPFTITEIVTMRNARIRTKLTAVVSLLMVALMAILAIAGYAYFARVFKQESAKHHFAMLSLAAGQLDAQVRRSQEILGMVSQSLSSVKLTDLPAVQGLLDNETDARTYFDGGFLLLDAKGRIITESPVHPEHRGHDHLHRKFVQKTLETGKPAISEPYISEAPPYEPTITFTTPIRDRSGKLSGLLAGRHLLMRDNYLSELSRITIGKTGYLYLVDSNRVIVMHPDKKRVMEQVAPGMNKGLDRALQGFEGTLENVNSKGLPGITSFKRLGSAHWVIGSHYPLSEAYAPIDQARIIFILAVALVLGVMLLALWLTAWRISAPLITLAQHVRALPSLENDQRSINLQTGDEIGELAEAFNDMVDQLGKRDTEIARNQNIYRIITKFTNEIAILMNTTGEILYISPNCETMLGYREDEFLADSDLLDRIVHPDDQQRWLDHRLNSLCKGDCHPLDLRLLPKSGGIIWVNHVCFEATNDQGEVIGIRGNFRDITRRIKLEHLLDEQVRFSENLLESTTTPLFVIDNHHRIIVWNRACADLTGKSSAEMIGTSHQWKAFYPEERPTVADLVLDGLEDVINSFYTTYETRHALPGVLRAEGWYYGMNGKDRYLFFDAAPVHDASGKVVAAVETLHDITDRKRAEESLRLFSQAVEQSGSSIVITDPMGTIQYVNERFCEATGYTREEAAGNNPRVLKSGEQPAELYTELWQTITAGHKWHGELHNKRKDGSLFWELVTISPIMDDSGIITHFLAVKEDITHRKEAERKLLKHQAELQLKHEQLSHLYIQVERGKREWEQTLDCIDDIVILVGENGVIRRCNRALLEFTNRDYQSVISSEWHDLFNDVGLDVDLLIGKSGELYHQQSGRWFTVRIYPYAEDKGAVISLHDLTAIKLVSDELAKAYEELKTTHLQLLQQEKMASIGQLAAGVAHEINNPMGFISSNLGTMAKYSERLKGFIVTQDEALNSIGSPELTASLADARKRYKIDYLLEDIPKLIAESSDGAERVRTIVQNLKSFSRIDDAELKPVDINECLESTISIAWNELKYKVTLQKEYGELPLVSCYPQQLNQVFLNLLVNGAHAIEKQGEITVKTWLDGKHACVSISDTGCGIPEEIRSRIFEPFFTTKEVGKGTGLGLSISYEIIQRHNGTIEVASEVGKGTTFTVRLPVNGGKAS